LIAESRRAARRWSHSNARSASDRDVRARNFGAACASYDSAVVTVSSVNLPSGLTLSYAQQGNVHDVALV
jgi:hypothetical protein